MRRAILASVAFCVLSPRVFSESFLLPSFRLSDLKEQSRPELVAGVPVEEGLRLTDAEAKWVGERIFANECSSRDACLTSWNEGEDDFASMGIGHALWYPAGRPQTYVETFPAMLRFLDANGVSLPPWLAGGPPNPWSSREEFRRDQQSERMRELRVILVRTKALQARFIADRAEAALGKLLEAAAPEERERVRFQFFRVGRNRPVGVYALVDYVNFKGEGVDLGERYKGQGWGLLQVLSGMSGRAEGSAALAEFADSAARMIDRRIRNSPPARNEAQWRAGWMKRIDTYRGPA